MLFLIFDTVGTLLTSLTVLAWDCLRIFNLCDFNVILIFFCILTLNEDIKGGNIMNRSKKSKMMILGVGIMMLLSGCQNTTSKAQTDYTTISLNGTELKSDGNAVSIDGKVATITAAGTYKITGSIEDGQIVVNATDKGTVTLVLSGANLTNQTGAPIWVEQADEVVLTLEKGTDNTITDGEVYDQAELGVDAAIYSSDDLKINGEGNLYVYANYNDGIISRDTLTIDGGNIKVTALNHGIKGKDYLLINDGHLVVDAGGDALKATNDTDTKLGYVQIEGGTLELKAMDDGIYGVTNVLINGGDIQIDSENNGVKSEENIVLEGGKVNIQTADDGLVATKVTGANTVEVVVNGVKIDLPS